MARDVEGNAKGDGEMQGTSDDIQRCCNRN
jgi:hypothetical protein